MNGKIDFNCDMGESFGIYKMGLDEEIMKWVTSANIACGFHAGDPMWMKHTVKLAEKNGVAIGAHPSYPDLRGFGRRDMMVTPEEVCNDVIYQVGALQAFTIAKGVQHVKPHGALYNQAVNDEDLSRAICEALLAIDSSIIFLTLSGSRSVAVAQSMGIRVAREVFADRAMQQDGTLVPRSVPGSVLHDVDEIVDRSLTLVIEGRTTAITGECIDLEADSICLHGDTPGALEMARRLKMAFENEGIEVLPLADIL